MSPRVVRASPRLVSAVVPLYPAPGLASVDFDADKGKIGLRATGSRLLFKGFLEVDHVEGLAQLAAPALLIWGEQDAFIPRAVQDELLGTLPDARLEVYEGVGHAVHWERPERFAREVAAFSRYSAGLPLSR